MNNGRKFAIPFEKVFLYNVRIVFALRKELTWESDVRILLGELILSSGAKNITCTKSENQVKLEFDFYDVTISIGQEHWIYIFIDYSISLTDSRINKITIDCVRHLVKNLREKFGKIGLIFDRTVLKITVVSRKEGIKKE